MKARSLQFRCLKNNKDLDMHCAIGDSTDFAFFLDALILPIDIKIMLCFVQITCKL
jgi:hypothetical protein